MSVEENGGLFDDAVSIVSAIKKVARKAGKKILNEQEVEDTTHLRKVLPELFDGEAAKTHWSADPDFDPNSEADRK